MNLPSNTWAEVSERDQDDIYNALIEANTKTEGPAESGPSNPVKTHE